MKVYQQMAETTGVKRCDSLLISSVISQDATSLRFKRNTQNGYIKMNQDKAVT